jgi:hypothetical protein
VYADASDHRVRRTYTGTLASETTTPHVLRYLAAKLGASIEHPVPHDHRSMGAIEGYHSSDLKAGMASLHDAGAPIFMWCALLHGERAQRRQLQAPGHSHLDQAAAVPTYGVLQVPSEEPLFTEIETDSGEATQPPASSDTQAASKVTTGVVAGASLQHIA